MSEWLSFFVEILPDLLHGLVITLKLTLGGLLIGFLVGLPAALARAYGPTWLRRLAIGYIELFRGTPLLVQLFVVYYGFPGIGLTPTRMAAAYLTMGLNSGAYQAEYLRGAIQAVGSGQMKAARAIGMSRWTAVRYIIMPQALRMVIPAWSNEPVSLLKASAVAFLIAVPDLMGQGKIISGRTFQPIETYLAVAVLYLVVVFALSAIIQTVENRVRIPGFEVEINMR